MVSAASTSTSRSPIRCATARALRSASSSAASSGGVSGCRDSSTAETTTSNFKPTCSSSSRRRGEAEASTSGRESAGTLLLARLARAGRLLGGGRGLLLGRELLGQRLALLLGLLRLELALGDLGDAALLLGLGFALARFDRGALLLLALLLLADGVVLLRQARGLAVEAFLFLLLERGAARGFALALGFGAGLLDLPLLEGLLAEGALVDERALVAGGRLGVAPAVGDFSDALEERGAFGGGQEVLEVLGLLEVALADDAGALEHAHERGVRGHLVVAGQRQDAAGRGGAEDRHLGQHLRAGGHVAAQELEVHRVGLLEDLLQVVARLARGSPDAAQALG